MTHAARPIRYTPELPTVVFRWTALRKLALIEAARCDPARKAELLKTYGVGEGEFERWVRAWKAIGLVGLKATYLQTIPREYRG